LALLMLRRVLLRSGSCMWRRARVVVLLHVVLDASWAQRGSTTNTVTSGGLLALVTPGVAGVVVVVLLLLSPPNHSAVYAVCTCGW
jgi:hypothetical protein